VDFTVPPTATGSWLLEQKDRWARFCPWFIDELN
jgi:hypothetical protein